MGKSWLDRYRTTLEAVLATLALVGILYAQVVVPHFDKLIEEKEKPIYDALEYNNCLHMAFMTQEQLDRAAELYKQSQLMKGAKTK